MKKIIENFVASFIIAMAGMFAGIAIMFVGKRGTRIIHFAIEICYGDDPNVDGDALVVK